MADEAALERLWAMADLFTPMALRVAATLRLADHVAAGAGTAAELARRTESDPDVLARLVDHLITVGVLERGDDDSLSLTDLGTELRDGRPGDGRASLDIEGAVGRADLCALRLLDTVRTGQPAYALTYGRGFWEDLAAEPALAESFDAFMGARLRSEAPEIASGYDWGALGHLVDVGGGNGTLLAAILAAHPSLRGTLVELPAPARAARETTAAAGVAERCEIVARSFFEPLPAGAGGYLLGSVLHDWDDAHALAILRRCADGAGATGRVLVIEHCEREGAASSVLRTGMDLRMLALNGGRERTLEALEQLAAHAGLHLIAVHPATRYRSMLELGA